MISRVDPRSADWLMRNIFGFSFQYKRGNTPIILSIPHGGLMDSDHIPDRQCHCHAPHDIQKCPIILKNDGYTIDLGLAIADSMLLYQNIKPYIVINHLKRSKLDPNRDIRHGAQENEAAIQAFQTYHKFISKAKTKFKRGLIIDLHGQNIEKITQLGKFLNLFGYIFLL